MKALGILVGVLFVICLVQAIIQNARPESITNYVVWAGLIVLVGFIVLKVGGLSQTRVVAFQGAVWASHKRLKNAGVIVREVKHDCLLLASLHGKYLVNRSTGDRPPAHTLLVGPPATGKSSTMRAMMLTWPGPVVCIDPVRPGADHYGSTAGYRATLGPVFVIDLSGGPGHRYDPLADSRTPSWAESASSVLLDVERAGNSDSAYIQKASSMLTATLRAAELAGEPRLPFVRQVFGSGLSKGYAIVRGIDPDLAETLTGGRRAESFMAGSWDTVVTRLGPLLSPGVLGVLSASDFAPSTLRDTNSTVYVRVAEEDLPALRPVVSLIVSSLIRSIGLSTPASSNVLVVLDEAATIRPPDLPDLSAWVGSRGMTLVLAAQSVAQLKAAYGQERANALLGNVTCRVTFRPGDHVSASELSQSLGLTVTHSSHFGSNAGSHGMTQSESVSETLTPLLPAHIARQLDARNVVVTLPGMPPILALRVAPGDLPGGPKRWDKPMPILPQPIPATRVTTGATVPLVHAEPAPAGGIAFSDRECRTEMETGRECSGQYPPQGAGILCQALEGLPADYVSKVQVSDDCWLWLGSTNKGYPLYGGDRRGAHVIMYEHVTGDLVQRGYEVDHIMPPHGVCRSTLCVRPDHLQKLTASQHRRITVERKKWRNDSVQKMIDDALGGK